MPSWSRINLRLVPVVVISFLFLVLVNQLVAQILRRQVDETALILATNLSDAAATYLASNDLLRLNTTVTKYARLSKIAYASITGRDGKIIAASPRTTASGFEQQLPPDHDQRDVHRRQITLNGETVYETSAPILEGRLGTARIGISAAAVDWEIYSGLLLFVWPIALGSLGAVLLLAVGSRLLLGSFWGKYGRVDRSGADRLKSSSL